MRHLILVKQFVLITLAFVVVRFEAVLYACSSSYHYFKFKYEEKMGEFKITPKECYDEAIKQWKESK